MVQIYADVDPDEEVVVTRVGRMTLRHAVHAYVAARLRYENGLMIAYRDAGKTPSMFHAADLGALAELEKFQ